MKESSYIGWKREIYESFQMERIKKSEIPVGTSFQTFSCSWAGGIRTLECRSQSPVPYRLATAQCITKLVYHR